MCQFATIKDSILQFNNNYFVKELWEKRFKQHLWSGEMFNMLQYILLKLSLNFIVECKLFII